MKKLDVWRHFWPSCSLSCGFNKGTISAASDMLVINDTAGPGCKGDQGAMPVFNFDDRTLSSQNSSMQHTNILINHKGTKRQLENVPLHPA